jgi:uncharacterized protein involved in propanediol utilization
MREFPDTAQQPLDMAEIAVIAGLALHQLGRPTEARTAAGYASEAVAADPPRFDPHMHERLATLRSLVPVSEELASSSAGDVVASLRSSLALLRVTTG